MAGQISRPSYVRQNEHGAKGQREIRLIILEVEQGDLGVCRVGLGGGERR